MKKKNLHLSVGGLNSENGEHVSWGSQNLNESDEIKIITKNFDPSISTRKPISKKDEIQEKIDYYYKLKEELKEYIKE